MTKQRQHSATCTWVVVVSPMRYVLDPVGGSFTYDKTIAHLWLDHDAALRYADRGGTGGSGSTGWAVERARI